MKIEERTDPLRVCLVNVGLYRTGSTTLIEAANQLGLQTHRKFPNDLSSQQLRLMLTNPVQAILQYMDQENGFQEILQLAKDHHDVIGDGWIPLLPFLPRVKLDQLQRRANEAGVQLHFVATVRSLNDLVLSELQHWVVHDLERKAGFHSMEERSALDSLLRNRATSHQERLEALEKGGLNLRQLPLIESHDLTSQLLSRISPGKDWSRALTAVGTQNANPKRPVEGILLTMRLGRDAAAFQKKAKQIETLLDHLEEDHLCRYLVVLALDKDEASSPQAKTLQDVLKKREEVVGPCQSVYFLTNPPRSDGAPFPICSIWNNMAVKAWNQGAHWVVLLGDDIQVNCSFHYRAIYRSFLSIAEKQQLPQPSSGGVSFFGCPWWNDQTFPGFPSFPCVGNAHRDIFGELIPSQRRDIFVNQDLDPYLQRMYAKFDAAPCVEGAVLSNTAGGNVDASNARYDRIPAPGWKDFVSDDVTPLRKYLTKTCLSNGKAPPSIKELILVDVVVPSYRVQLDYLESICNLKVPEYMGTLFIIIVDNPEELLAKAASLQPPDDDTAIMSLEDAERILEAHLVSQSGNEVRVRCNRTNVGASASRNRGLDESAAEFVLNLDDDLKANPNLLKQYGDKLKNLDDSVVGLIGLVRFPRSLTLPLKHAAVLMSYLTFMFEIAEQKLDSNPRWGVTANILYRRTHVRFDLAYAKTGGGEDVDFALHVSKAHPGGGVLLPVKEAQVVHPFWPGSAWTLASHFFNWAIGDGSLFQRFPEHRYWSFPNLPETVMVASPLVIGSLCSSSSFLSGLATLLLTVVVLMVAEFMVDACHLTEYHHRCCLVQTKDSDQSPYERPLERSRCFYFLAHFLASIYVIVLESGRLWGHVSRGEAMKYGICRRFDWHCGRLPNACRNFRRREAIKFLCFVAILAWVTLVKPGLGVPGLVSIPFWG